MKIKCFLIGFIACGIIAFFAGFNTHVKELPPPVIQQVNNIYDVVKYKNAVVLIESNNGGFGSGFFIDDHGLIVTAKHVIELESPFKIKLTDGRCYTADITVYSDNYDVGFIKIDCDTSTIKCKLSSIDDVKQFDEICIIGTPAIKSMFNTTSIGTVFNPHIDLSGDADVPNDTSNLIGLSVTIFGGNSGSPVFNKHGYVIGIVTMGLDNQYCYAEPVSVFRNYIGSIKLLFDNNTGLIGIDEFSRYVYDRSREQ